MKTSVKRKILPILLLIFLAFAMVFPLTEMMLNIQPNDFVTLIQTEKFLTSLKHSVIVSLTTTVLAVICGLLLAIVQTRTSIRGKSIYAILLIIPMLIPSISNGTGLILLFGSNGIVTRLFNMNQTIYGFRGIVFGSFLYAYPTAYLMFCNALRFEDGTQYQAARVFGIKPWHQFLDIAIPYLKKTILSVSFAVFSMVFTDYGVPLSIGGKYLTLPVVLYQETIGKLNFSTGSAIAVFLLIPAVIAFVLDLKSKNYHQENSIKLPVEPYNSKVFNYFGTFISILFSAFVVLINGAFMLLAFSEKYPSRMNFSLQNVFKTFQLNGMQYLLNSIFIAVIVAVIGTFIGLFCAYFSSRTNLKSGKILHLLSMLTLAIPGVVLGLSYSISFNSWFFYGTMTILILVNIVHFFSSPYLMMVNTLSKMNEHIEEVGDTLGISRFSLIKDVVLPQVSLTMMEMASYFFMNCMVTISAVSFLATTATKPFALMINQFEALLTVECSAVVTLVILGCNILIRLLFTFIRNRMEARTNEL